MALRKSQIEDHIEVLEDFETKYGAFLLERRARAEEERRWHGEEWAERQRELKELAPQAEAAMVAAGAKRWDGGPVAIDLPHRIFNFADPGDGVDDDEEQWKILDELPTHIGALKGRLRQAEDDDRRKAIGADFGDLADRQANDPYGYWAMTETQLVNVLGNDPTVPGYEHAKQVLAQKRREADERRAEAAERNRRGEQWVEKTNRRGHEVEAREAREAEEAKHGWLWRQWHDPNLWIVTIVGGVIVGLVLWAILTA